MLPRFWQYLTERFPLHQHGPLIAAFTFSAISYSRIVRGAEGFIDWQPFTWAVFSNLTLFFLLRVFDEFKDAKDDAAYRQDLPVPRGLITLREIGVIGGIVWGVHLLGQVWFYPELLGLYAMVLGFLLLMRVEFFVGEWLKARPLAYALSHMLIIPLIDVFASGYDWQLAKAGAPPGMGLFFAVSFVNGLVLEIGRKIRAPEDERPGVLTYSAQHGWRKAVWLWVGALGLTYGLAAWAGDYAGYGWGWQGLLVIPFGAGLLVAYRFAQAQTSARAKAIELTAGIWALLMYLLLGAGPMIAQWIS